MTAEITDTELATAWFARDAKERDLYQLLTAADDSELIAAAYGCGPDEDEVEWASHLEKEARRAEELLASWRSRTPEDQDRLKLAAIAITGAPEGLKRVDPSWHLFGEDVARGPIDPDDYRLQLETRRKPAGPTQASRRGPAT